MDKYDLVFKNIINTNMYSPNTVELNYLHVHFALVLSPSALMQVLFWMSSWKRKINRTVTVLASK
jgi:hypothetical protein